MVTETIERTRKRGRPKTGFNKREHDRQKAAEKRAAIKLQKAGEPSADAIKRAKKRAGGKTSSVRPKK